MWGLQKLLIGNTSLINNLKGVKNVRNTIATLENSEFEMGEYQAELITVDSDEEVADLVDWVETFNR